ncbi:MULTISPECIES: PRC-barrel domain containing protein [unclassified Isoptericola]|uniref:PRC-barrel domain containing protein n=1 Tax=unclassified Isoptericola TaxID=2623355 RepID=UPI0036657A58
MNVGDLLDVPVVDHDGAPLGVVVDVRLALEVVDEPEGAPGAGEDREEPEHDGPLSAQARRDAVGRARVVGLLVGPRGAGSFHGYERTDVRSPWPVPQLVRRRHRGTFLVRWADVEALGDGAGGGGDDGSVRLARGYEQLPPDLG